MSAKHSIELEQYIFENDACGQKFLKLFILKAKQGLKISMMCDNIGSLSLSHSPLIKEFQLHGGHFSFYNSVKWIDLLTPKHLFPRTHVKTLVVDGGIAYVGGVCLDQRMKDWRDTQIRITGPMAQVIRSVTLNNISGISSLNPPDLTNNSDFTYIQSEPKFFRHPLYRLLLDAIRDAQKYIYISAAFFVPTRRMRRYLKHAALRGVRVIILIPRRSDFLVADLASLSYVMGLLKHGIHIYRYQPSVLHNKTVVIDNTWGTVGSSNMDALSFFYNRESNLIIRNQAALSQMERDYNNDLKVSQEITLDIMKQIPIWERMAMHGARLFRAFL
jgi:cardiolipin synthase